MVPPPEVSRSDGTQGASPSSKSLRDAETAEEVIDHAIHALLARRRKYAQPTQSDNPPNKYPSASQQPKLDDTASTCTTTSATTFPPKGVRSEGGVQSAEERTSEVLTLRSEQSTEMERLQQALQRARDDLELERERYRRALMLPDAEHRSSAALAQPARATDDVVKPHNGIFAQQPGGAFPPRTWREVSEPATIVHSGRSQKLYIPRKSSLDWLSGGAQQVGMGDPRLSLTSHFSTDRWTSPSR